MINLILTRPGLEETEGPSAEIGPEHALFQPSHGTAPSIVGKNLANPLATILSAAMMFDWLGVQHADATCKTAAKSIERAVEQLLQRGEVLTPDIGGQAGTKEVAEAVAECLETPVQR